MSDKPFETPWRLFWCADAAEERLLHVSEAVSSVLGMTPGALLEDPLQWNHAVLPADAGALPRPFFAADLPCTHDGLREYRMLGADLHLYQVRDRRFRWRDPLSGRMHVFGMVEGMRELRPEADAPIEPSWEHLWDPVAAGVGGAAAAAPAPRPGPDPGADPGKEDRSGSVPRTPDPARETDENEPAQPHEHGDDPGVHPDGPKRYHDDYGTPRRMSHDAGREVMTECQP